MPGRHDQAGKVGRGRGVVRRQAGGLFDIGAAQPDFHALVAHRQPETVHAARIGPGQCERGAVVGRHQRQFQQRAAAKGCTHRDRDELCLRVSTSSSVMVMAWCMSRFASSTTIAVISLVSDAIGRTASEFLLNRISFVSWSATRATPELQLERIGGVVQADQLTERRLRRLGADRDDPARALTAGPDDEHLTHVRIGGDLGQPGRLGAALRRLGGR